MQIETEMNSLGEKTTTTFVMLNLFQHLKITI